MHTEPLFEYDPRLAGEFAARVESVYRTHALELGRPLPYLPAFGFRTAPPNADAIEFAPALHYHLQQLNRPATPPTEPDLAPSTATQFPLFGRLWNTVRSELHQVILFYVNRLQRTHTQETTHLVNSLNELARIAVEQQAEIDRLRDELAHLKRDNG